MSRLHFVAEMTKVFHSVLYSFVLPLEYRFPIDSSLWHVGVAVLAGEFPVFELDGCRPSLRLHCAHGEFNGWALHGIDQALKMLEMRDICRRFRTSS